MVEGTHFPLLHMSEILEEKKCVPEAKRDEKDWSKDQPLEEIKDKRVEDFRAVLEEEVL